MPANPIIFLQPLKRPLYSLQVALKKLYPEIYVLIVSSPRYIERYDLLLGCNDYWTMTPVDHGMFGWYSQDSRKVHSQEGYLPQSDGKRLLFFRVIGEWWRAKWGQSGATCVGGLLKVLDADVEFGGFWGKEDLKKLIETSLLSLQVDHLAHVRVITISLSKIRELTNE